MSTSTPLKREASGPASSGIDGGEEPEQPMANNDGGFEMVLSREEKRKQRKVDKQRPQFQFDTSYFRGGKKIGIAHIRDLILYIVADAQRPGWIVPEHKAQITHTIILFIPGLLPEHIGLPPIPIAATLPFSTNPTHGKQEDFPPNRVPVIRQLFTYGCPTRAPGDHRRLHSVTGTLLSSPLPDAVRKKREEESRKVARLAKSDSSPLTYILSPHQIIDNDYRLPSYVSPSSPSDELAIPRTNGTDTSEDGPSLSDRPAAIIEPEFVVPPSTISMTANGRPTVQVDRQRGNVNGHEGWVETPKAEGPPPDGLYPVLAIDCEMVLSEDGQELARVSVIDYQSGVNVFDELVKPPKPVADYRTQWSGMTACKLSKAGHTLASIQQALSSGPSPLITPHTILLGHSLECDLAALRIRHPLCIDTALLFSHPRGPPYKPGLKWLAQRWLGKDIQGGEKGHDSEEDARTCVELLKMKMANGPDFGTFLDNSEPIFERMNRFHAVSARPGRTSAVCDYFNPGAGYGAKATTATKCSNDEEVVEAICAQVEGHDLVFGRLMELSNVQGWNGDHKPSEPLPLPSDETSCPPSPSSSTDAALDRLNTRLTTIHASLPAHSALIILTGHSSPLPMLEMTAKRQKWERLVKTLGGTEGVPKEERWLSEDDRKLEEAVYVAREGMSFFCVKGRDTAATTD